MIYVMIGGPATGKGTRGKVLSEAFKIPHISTGDLLREVAQKDDKIKEKLSTGELIPDEFVTDMLNKRLAQVDCKNGFILDGYPRTEKQAELLDKELEKLNQKITLAVELVVPDELACKRILARKKCKVCGAEYGYDFAEKVPGICDVCGAKLDSRSDDTEETLKNRIAIYKKNAAPIIEYYRKQDVLKTIDSSDYYMNIVNEVKKI